MQLFSIKKIIGLLLRSGGIWFFFATEYMYFMKQAQKDSVKVLNFYWIL